MADTPAADPADAARLVGPLRTDPGRTVLLFDFDGTLSPTVADPAAARPAPGAVELLVELAARYRTVGVVSGRPVAFLEPLLPSPPLVLSGQYGLESVVDGERAARPDVEPWRAVVAEAEARLAAAVPAGVRVEPKGLTITVHYREVPEHADAAWAVVADVAAATGLAHRAAKMSVELVPPVEATKAQVVRRWGADADAVLYAGDDLGDLSAFEALAELRTAGVRTVALAVAGPELPPELAAAADVVLASPAAAVDLLRRLAA
ncbi:MAG: trehalose-phosphatase [Actinobacteria bacterium]|nr:trehalose-phosphatase [Actinomycetota bacterium]